MARFIKLGLLPPDDPIFTGGVQSFSVRRPSKPTEEEQKPVKPSPDEQEKDDE